MNVRELELFTKLDEIKEWVAQEWDIKEAEGKIFCMDYIEPFIEIESLIEDRDNLEELQKYCYTHMSFEDMQAIKRMYEETSHFIGFNSLEVNYFIDNVIDEIKRVQRDMEEKMERIGATKPPVTIDTVDEPETDNTKKTKQGILKRIRMAINTLLGKE
jgi:hypothetical protein